MITSNIIIVYLYYLLKKKMLYIFKQTIPNVATYLFLPKIALNFRNFSGCHQDISNELESELYYVCPPNVADKFDRKHVQNVMEEMDFNLRFGHARMPTNLTDFEWEKIISALTSDTRKKLYVKFYLRKKTDEFNKLMKQTMGHKDLNTSDAALSSTLRKWLFRSRVTDNMLKKWLELKSINVKSFGPPLLLDWSYDHLMNPSEIHICTKQVFNVLSNNWQLSTYFNIINCNVRLNGPMMTHMKKINFNVTEKTAFNFTEQKITDLFPSEKLIYLSPHASEVMENYEYDKVYIVGAFVDLMANDYISTNKALVSGIKTMKLPLDKYLHWCQGTQSLSLNQVIALLSDAYTGINWTTSLKRITLCKRKFNAISH